MKINNLVCFLLLGFLFFVACQRRDQAWEAESNRVASEARTMLENYFADINAEGPMAEFKYLDTSDLFSWQPPGYSMSIGFDSVRSILMKDAASGIRPIVYWDSLKIFPLSADEAKYTGKIRVYATAITGRRDTFHLNEEGNLIRKEDGWKLLNGKTVVGP